MLDGVVEKTWEDMDHFEEKEIGGQVRVE